MPADQIQYSEKYCDERYEYRYRETPACCVTEIFIRSVAFYRHVILPADLSKMVPKTHLMTESEWRNLGVQQSPGWVQYMIHAPEPHVLLFRRLLPEQEPRLQIALTGQIAAR